MDDWREPRDGGSTRRGWLAGALALLAGARAAAAPATAAPQVPVLVYHRFAPTVVDGMTVRLTTFEAHLRMLERLGAAPIALRELVAWRLGRRDALPPRAVALSADDGHRTQAEAMAPALRERGWPLTLFVYPSAISNAAYAMTWPQLAALQAQGTADVESHTYWHPNLPRERARMEPEAFRRFAAWQLERSKAVLEERLGRGVTLLAWPFGLTDESLAPLAAQAGYAAAFTLEPRAVGPHDPPYALPRRLVTDALDAPALGRWLQQAWSAAATA